MHHFLKKVPEKHYEFLLMNDLSNNKIVFTIRVQKRLFSHQKFLQKVFMYDLLGWPELQHIVGH